ncbi:MAG TPA: LacI family DNA-binding transcriptional regulator [Beutenbergiaceae bacterium]|nr:LacI family DNA-binding transcriptional regulator [Beutenbergiaceae bacterium]
MAAHPGRITIADVARAAGVSTATVSKVINGRYGVAASTGARVRDVIEELGYVSSLGARSLRSRRTGVLGILVADFEPFSTELLKGASRAVHDTGYELLAYSVGRVAQETTGWERRSLSQLHGTLIDGAILCTPTIEAVPAGLSVVAVDPHAGPTALPTVDSDNLGGAVLATNHLLDLGHRRIAFIGGRDDLNSSRERERGYRAAMQRAGVGVEERLVRHGDYTTAAAAFAVAELFAAPDRPTAVFAANDLSALGVLQAAAEAGLSVPADVSVVGFDNIPEAVLAAPPLTTVDQPIQQMGEHALTMLIDLLAGAEVDEHIRLPTRLLVRDSCASPTPTDKPAMENQQHR